jgi:hypothetical protein
MLEGRRPKESPTLRYVERTQQNPYGLVVSSVEQTEIPVAFFSPPRSLEKAP